MDTANQIEAESASKKRKRKQRRKKKGKKKDGEGSDGEDGDLETPRTEQMDLNLPDLLSKEQQIEEDTVVEEFRKRLLAHSRDRPMPSSEVKTIPKR